ncbi:MAG: N-glycosylase/DNA lyase [Thermoplasmatales archaeon]|nr:MAG: N-glycosylase/DNA lyase [Thermoplasmatales archaeon]
MNDLIDKIESLKKSRTCNSVNNRIKEFKNINKKSSDELFKEMCFCLLTANFNAEKCIRIQKEIGANFLTISEKDLAKKLSELGHRYPNTRAKYISDSVKYNKSLKDIICSYRDEELREWLIKNIKGLGYKESSHFLRNIGFDNFAIIDFHIVDLLTSHNIIRRPKTLTKIKYLEIENILRKLAKKTNLTLAELDLYLWYMETGKILK